MKKQAALGFVVVAGVAAVAFMRPAPQAGTPQERARWQQEAANVTIVRDDWGIAHVHGKTDADAVFGMEYAQAEDDFNRVENNYLTSLGRMSEAQGESAVWQDLRMRLFLDPTELQQQYAASPAWLKKLMDAFADGLNYYLATHPQVHPRAIAHFEPWMALSFTEGSIGGDMEKVNLGQLQRFYSQPATVVPTAAGGPPPAPVSDDFFPPEPGGSNGIAIAPANTTVHHALLLINPHTSFYFRSELQMSSDEGLNAYGAVTWGQFFIYQGFNDRTGWMHTSSGVNATTQYLETVSPSGAGFTYKHGPQELPVASRPVTIAVKGPGGLTQRVFTVYSTRHGPVIGSQNGKWITMDLMNEPVKALTQSYTRTKARNLKEFAATLELHTNSSNNTIYADADGNIAYWHANFIPVRDPRFDWARPVDGGDPATDWKGLLSVEQSPRVIDPPSGWVYNSNNWPWSVSGPDSPRREDFPAYVDTGNSESERGYHAIRLLTGKKDFTLDGLQAAAFDSYQPWFEKRLPALIKAWDSVPDSDPLKARTADAIALLRNWDLRWAANSVPTSVAIYWATDVQRAARGGGGRRGGAPAGAAAPPTAAPQDPIVAAPADTLLASLAAACDKLTADFGTWKVPWGDINRFQRLDDNIVGDFSDAQPSIPVEFTTATWGSLASFAARAYNGSKKIYGSSGNSFVAVVEFGPTVRAKAVTAGGESGDPKSKHFNDQAERYANGNLREVYFYKAQLAGHTEREYHPGQ